MHIFEVLVEQNHIRTLLFFFTPAPWSVREPWLEGSLWLSTDFKKHVFYSKIPPQFYLRLGLFTQTMIFSVGCDSRIRHRTKNRIIPIFGCGCHIQQGKSLSM
jgi:hypothetical protein